jgi:hypothetical protein
MKFKFTAIGFILGVITSISTYFFIGDSIQDEVAVLEQTVGKKVHTIGKQIQRAGRGMIN